MSESDKDGKVDQTPARTDDDPQKAAEEVVEAGHDTSGGDSDSEATGTGPSGGGEDASPTPPPA